MQLNRKILVQSRYKDRQVFSMKNGRISLSFQVIFNYVCVNELVSINDTDNLGA